MRKSGRKLGIDELTERDLSDARKIIQFIVDSQTKPASTLGVRVVDYILHRCWRGGKRFSKRFSNRLTTGLDDGLSAVLRDVTDATTLDDLPHEFGVTLSTVIISDIRDVLFDAVFRGVDSTLLDQLEYKGLNRAIFRALNGLHDGLYRHIRKMSELAGGYCFCGVSWSRTLALLLIPDRFGCRLDQERLFFLRALCVLCPILADRRGKLVIMPKPQVIRWRTEGRTPPPFEFPIYELHSNGRPSVEYWGLFNLYHWHNTEIPERMGRTYSEHWRPEWLLDEPNVEVRRILIQEIGYERLIKTLGATVKDTWREYELIDLVAPNMPIQYRLLKMTCPSTGEIHILRVPPDCDTAENAITWCNRGHHPDEFLVQH